MSEKSRVYALLDEQNNVTRIEGEYTLPADLSGWTFIEDGTPCDRLNLAQSHYLDKPIMTDEGVYRYRCIDGVIYEKSQAEIDSEITPEIVTPSIEERLNDMENALCELFESLG